MLVHGDERTESRRGELLEEDRVRGLVALEDLGLDKRLVLGERLPKLLPDGGLRLAERERLGLGEEVGKKDLVVLASGDRVERLDRGEEVAGDELGALVDELVEGVLSVGSSLSPDDRARLIVDPRAVLGDELAVRLHVALLEVVGELVEVLIVGEERLGLGAYEKQRRMTSAFRAVKRTHTSP